MGNEQSTENNNGDAQINIVNTLNSHSEKHYNHELKLYLILFVVTLQLILTLYKIYKNFYRRQALKAAKTVSALNEVITNK